MDLYIYFSHFFYYHFITLSVILHYFHIFISIPTLIICCYTSYFLHLECWFFTYWCIKGSHITLFIPSFDTNSEIFVWEVVSWDGVHVFINDLREFVHSLYFSHWSSTYWRSKRKSTMICLCMYLTPLGTYVTFRGLFIRHICHYGFLWDFYMSFHSLSHSCYALGVSRVHVSVLWDPILLGSWLICIRYER